MEDPVFKGNQNFKFEMDLDEAGRRLFGGEANAGVAFQIGQLRYVILLNMYVHVTNMYVICTYIENDLKTRLFKMISRNLIFLLL